MNTHWIDYTPKSVARITNIEPVDKQLKQATSSDVNRLSRIVVKFNDWLVNGKGRRYPWDYKMSQLLYYFQTL